jgi:uncharacterized protein
MRLARLTFAVFRPYIDRVKEDKKSEFMSDRVKIPIPKEQVAEFCRKHHIRKLSLFGSVLRDDFCSESDIDVLVEFEPGKTPGLAFFAIQDELSELLGRNVDLNTPMCLSRYFRDKALAEAEAVYVEA